MNDTDIARVLAKVDAGIVRGLEMACEHLLGASRPVVPIEEGTLERSGYTDVDAGALRGVVGYKGPYAVYQHERLDLRHDPGRTAKYLETPLRAEREVLLALVAAGVREELG